jgi:putative ABC transport system substrate-binding protein
VIGYLHGQSPDRLPHLMAAFRQGLNDVGYAEGQNVTIEYRAAATACRHWRQIWLAARSR